MLVLTPSAAGRRIGLTAEYGLTLGGTHHLALLNHPAVAEQLRAWLSVVLTVAKVATTTLRRGRPSGSL